MVFSFQKFIYIYIKLEDLVIYILVIYITKSSNIYITKSSNFAQHIHYIIKKGFVGPER